MYLNEAMTHLAYDHGSKVVVETSIGNIELTYHTRAGDRADNAPIAQLFENFDTLKYGDARDEDTYFEATLIDAADKIQHIGYGRTPTAAIRQVYHQHADAVMERDLYPTPAEGWAPYL